MRGKKVGADRRVLVAWGLGGGGEWAEERRKDVADPWINNGQTSVASCMHPPTPRARNSMHYALVLVGVRLQRETRPKGGKVEE